MSDEATTPPTMDPLALMREAYARGVEAWASAMEEIVGSDEFAAGSGRLLALYAQQQEGIRTASRLAAESIHMPTSEDIASLARLVANVERKVDESADAVMMLGERLAVTEATAGRLAGIEAAVAAVSVQTIAGLETRLSDIEEAVARVEAALSALSARSEAASADAEKAPKSSSTGKTAAPAKAASASAKGESKAAPKRTSRSRTTAASRKAADGG
jgi:hypothetical protein